MTPNKDGTASYAATCNPPRRAKRARTDTDTAAPSPATSQQQLRPQLLPKETARTPAVAYNDSSEDEDDYDPVATPPAPKRRGRKPGPLSRSARESQRKLNHSRIEKARRTKINETLATLSNLVSEAEMEKAAADPSHVVVEAVKERGGEKEFKLDVLVKTVAYIEELIQKVKTLESQPCSNCSSGVSSSEHIVGAKRKRQSGDEDEEVEIVKISRTSHNEAPHPDEHRHNDMPSPRQPPSRSMSRQPGQSPCLPPISAWLPHPYIDPSCLSDANLPPSSHQLPTPPLSGSFRTPLSHPTQTLPALSLPGPAHPMTSYPSSPESMKSVRMRAEPPRRLSSASARSPPVSPSWTPEDETAASMLLQMSSSPASSVSGSVPATTPKMQPRHLDGGGRRASYSQQIRAETPGSLLGLGKAL